MTAEKDTDTAERDTDAQRKFLEYVEAAMAACEGFADEALARHTGRKLLAVVSCAADALLRDGGVALAGAPDKVGAFFERAAAGYVAAIEGLHKRAVLADAAANGFAPARPVVDPLARSIAAWGAPARE